jgi:hypothetical protein
MGTIIHDLGHRNKQIMGKGDNKKSKKSTGREVETNEAGMDNTAVRKRRTKKEGGSEKEIFFSRDNYIIIGVGLVIVVLGLFLMSGGNNGPDEWDINEIYSSRRITLAPMVILAGLAVVILAIFKSPSTPIGIKDMEEAVEE